MLNVSRNPGKITLDIVEWDAPAFYKLMPGVAFSAARRRTQRTKFASCNSSSRVIDRLGDLPNVAPIFEKITIKSNQDPAK